MGADQVSKVNNLHFKTYSELVTSLQQSGIESLQSVIFIDFSKSNQWTGEKSYGYCLHDITKSVTPYEHVLNTLEPVLKNFDDDDIYPVYRFGCINTRDQTVLPLLHPINQDEHIKSMSGVCQAYRQIAASVQMSGPTTFAPAIARAIQIAQTYKQQGIKQHIICIIITDGDVSDFKKDSKAVCDASNYPISICAIGVGDGPFKDMDKFDKMKSGRKFDNFHFCNFTEFIQQHTRDENPELSLATQVFTEVGVQYQAMKRLGYL